MSQDRINRAWLVARPMGPIPQADDFDLAVIPMPEPDEGQVLMRTIYISISPGSRPLLPYAGSKPNVANDGSAGRADATGDALPDPARIRIGERMRAGIVPSMSPFAGGTVGQVVTSRHAAFKAGDYIFGGRYWQEYEVVDGDASTLIDQSVLPIEADLTMLGRSAFTGWTGYRHFCAARAGEVLVVSAAAGAVGMLIVQMAKADGLTVIGIASGDDKCRFVTQELGADACIDRNISDVGKELDRLVPDGVDIYFDNVGGKLLQPIFARLKPFGRLIVCGMAAEYGGAESSSLPAGLILSKRLRIQGFVVLDHDDEYGRFRSEIADLWSAGKLTYRQEIFDGIERAPDALAACLTGQSSGGKIFVKVGE